MSKIYEGAIGVVIRLDTGVDISAATVTKYKVHEPDGTEVEWTTSAYDSTTMTYTTTEALVSGIYLIQTYAEWGSGSKHLGDTYALEVTAEYD